MPLSGYDSRAMQREDMRALCVVAADASQLRSEPFRHARYSKRQDLDILDAPPTRVHPSNIVHSPHRSSYQAYQASDITFSPP